MQEPTQSHESDQLLQKMKGSSEFAYRPWPTGMQLAEWQNQILHFWNICCKVYMLTKRHDWSIFTTPAVAEKMSGFSVNAFSTLLKQWCVMCQILQHNWSAPYCVVRHSLYAQFIFWRINERGSWDSKQLRSHYFTLNCQTSKKSYTNSSISFLTDTKDKQKKQNTNIIIILTAVSNQHVSLQLYT